MVLRTAEDKEVMVIGERWNYMTNVISALRAKKLVQKGFKAYLDYISKTKVKSPTVKELRTVKEFPDVFPKELPGLPPSREVEFGIELLPGTALVPIAHYRMAPKELVELKPVPGKEFMVYSDASHVGLGSVLMQEGKIRSKQLVDETLGARFKQVESGETLDFGINSEGVLCFCGRMYIPKGDDLRQSILQEAHSGLFAMHPGGNKMYRNLRELYWWPGLKRKVMEFVNKCLVCQKVKAEHQLPSWLLQPVKITLWK
ncbi:uncharacterized protein LOC128291579 [Gossypium arboreum]|uniref:uncharacterized protein LOC128291579 n=1 Tax=Gossypium arboreum TaxID=29729 RepID=UPI0022F1A4C9|nr:uncharacterized protein LOC128291579 [Gossypium arboreum]